MQSPEYVAFSSVAGLTGVLITVSLILIVSTAVEQMRYVHCSS